MNKSELGFRTRLAVVGNDFLHNGTHFDFKNGVCVSVQYGREINSPHYCDKIIGYLKDFYNDRIRQLIKGPHKINYGDKEIFITRKSPFAEVAIFGVHGEDLTTEYFCDRGFYACNDLIITHISPDSLADILFWAKNYKARV